MLNNKKGITLIALVVTVVVLIILAGVSINAVLGDNGIIKKANQAASVTKEAEVKEAINRTILEFYLTNDYETLEDFLKAKVTEDLKLKIIGDVQNTIKTINLDIEHFEFQAKKALSQAASDLSVLPPLREQIEMERNKINAAKAEAEDKLKRAEALEIGAEIGHGTLERTVEITIGTDIDALMGAEILTEDGKIIAFRE